MEKTTAVNTCLGVLKGRDCIYLDQVKQDDLNNLTFMGDINGHLISDVYKRQVLNGTARENHSAYPTVVRNHNGTPFLPSQLLERYLSKLPLQGFPLSLIHI